MKQYLIYFLGLSQAFGFAAVALYQDATLALGTAFIATAYACLEVWREPKPVKQISEADRDVILEKLSAMQGQLNTMRVALGFKESGQRQKVSIFGKES